jgi:hypothetical protein
MGQKTIFLLTESQIFNVFVLMLLKSNTLINNSKMKKIYFGRTKMQSLKQSTPNDVDGEYETAFKEVHLLKQLSPTNKTDDGISTEERDEHSEKQNESIKLTDFGIDIDFKFAHFINDFSPNV